MNWLGSIVFCEYLDSILNDDHFNKGCQILESFFDQSSQLCNWKSRL